MNVNNLHIFNIQNIVSGGDFWLIFPNMEIILQLVLQRYCQQDVVCLLADK